MSTTAYGLRWIYSSVHIRQLCSGLVLRLKLFSFFLFFFLFSFLIKKVFTPQEQINRFELPINTAAVKRKMATCMQ